MAKKRKMKIGDPDMTAFSDIAFLLIIFFILVTSLTSPMGRIIDMPSAAKPETQAEEDKTPSVNILSDRITFAEGSQEAKEITTAELRALLRQYGFLSKTNDNDRMVLVETADEVTYQRYYEIATMIAECGGIIAMIRD